MSSRGVIGPLLPGMASRWVSLLGLLLAVPTLDGTGISSATLCDTASELCGATPGCSDCFTALISTADTAQTSGARITAESLLFLTLVNVNADGVHSTRLCPLPHTMAGTRLYAAVSACLGSWAVTNDTRINWHTPLYINETIPAGAMAFNGCASAELACWNSTDCAHCLTQLYTDGSDKREVLLAPRCRAVATQRLIETVADLCIQFPRCTASKIMCSNNTACTHCMAMLQDDVDPADVVQIEADCGNVGGTFRSGSKPAKYLDDVVSSCVKQLPISCIFFHMRCANSNVCRPCLAELRTGLVSGFMSSGCNATRSLGYADAYLFRLADTCPDVSPCMASSLFCMSEHVPGCRACLMAKSGNLLPNMTQPGPNCEEILQKVFVTQNCAPCSPTVYLINQLTVCTTVAGWMSLVGCTVGLLALLIGRPSQSTGALRERVLIMLLGVNALYSIANIIPIGQLSTDSILCGSPALSESTIQMARALWFGSKYSIVCLEICMVLCAIIVMRKGMGVISMRHEVAMYLGCTVVGIAAFIGFYIRSMEITDSGLNSATYTESAYGSFNHLGHSSDDDNAELPASEKYSRALEEYNRLVQIMLVVWSAGLLPLAIIFWGTLRVMFVRLVAQMRAKLAASVQHWSRSDSFVYSQGPSALPPPGIAQEALELVEEGYSMLAKPLEPFLVVFIFFGIPAAVMSTSYCEQRSGTEDFGPKDAESGFSAARYRYGTCFAWCELLLAFRSFITVCVFFLFERHRGFLRTAVARALVGFRGWSGCQKDDSRTVRFLRRDARKGSSDSKGSRRRRTIVGGVHLHQMQMVEEWEVAWRNVKCEDALAEGTFGEVWSGWWNGLAVAIKLIKRSRPAGDIPQEYLTSFERQDEELSSAFKDECRTLRKIRHRNVLRFYGAGTTTDGRLFAITELMEMGSLRHVLDRDEAMSWQSRHNMALQVSCGMEYLHGINVIHRDLKSENCLVGCDGEVKSTENKFVVKVGDFGTATHGEQPELVTGVGTPLWMAPEVLEMGSGNSSSDVYSMGIVMWEIATGDIPWSTWDRDDYLTFSQELLIALNGGQRPVVPPSVEAGLPIFCVVMRKCWATDPKLRPAFSEIRQHLEAAASGLLRVEDSVSLLSKFGDREPESRDVLHQPLLSRIDADTDA
eukprot:m.63461 g.63461  ORF g.63461 m.63461 type:complete len:1151 (+) comp17789_c1_seq1:288-3740(+)